MRVTACAAACFLALTAAAQQPPAAVPPRFGIEAEVRNYPQATAKDTLRSVIEVVERRRVSYLLAHLADPVWVDKRLADGKIEFDQFVREVGEHFTNKPDTLRDLRRFLKEGEWQETESTAVCRLKDVKDRVLRLVRRDDRWFLEDNSKPEAGR